MELNWSYWPPEVTLGQRCCSTACDASTQHDVGVFWWTIRLPLKQKLLGGSVGSPDVTSCIVYVMYGAVAKSEDTVMMPGET